MPNSWIGVFVLLGILLALAICAAPAATRCPTGFHRIEGVCQQYGKRGNLIHEGNWWRFPYRRHHGATTDH